MPQIAQPGRESVGRVKRIAAGGVCAWRLPPDASCASAARSLIRTTMTTLELTGELVDAAVLAASELATNALVHGLRAEPDAPVVPPELWVSARAMPVPRLIVAVFDVCRSAWPDTTYRDPMDEHGRGLEIVGAVADAWGAHRSRSHLGVGPQTGGLPGKVVWSAFPLPGPWPHAGATVAPAIAARTLAGALNIRGIENVAMRCSDWLSLVTVPLRSDHVMNVWVRPGSLMFIGSDGMSVRRPMIELQDVAEQVVRRVEEDRR